MTSSYPLKSKDFASSCVQAFILTTYCFHMSINADFRKTVCTIPPWTIISRTRFRVCARSIFGKFDIYRQAGMAEVIKAMATVKLCPVRLSLSPLFDKFGMEVGSNPIFTTVGTHFLQLVGCYAM